MAQTRCVGNIGSEDRMSHIMVARFLDCTARPARHHIPVATTVAEHASTSCRRLSSRYDRTRKYKPCCRLQNQGLGRVPACRAQGRGGSGRQGSDDDRHMSGFSSQPCTWCHASVAVERHEIEIRGVPLSGDGYLDDASQIGFLFSHAPVVHVRGAGSRQAMRIRWYRTSS